MTERIALPWDMTTAVCYSGGDYTWDVEDDDPDRLAFEAEYEVVGNQFLGNPNESYYQGISFVAVIRRKADGALFGYDYWEDISKHGEAYVEPNGYEYGQPDDSDDAVWFPVEPFTVTGYQTKKEEA